MRSTTALLTALLLALQAPGKDDDPNPEPPPPGPISARLVAKKTTYKLDLGGLTPAKFRAKIAAGGANLPAAPAVDLEMVITNNTKSDIRVRTTGSVPRMSLTLSGGNVVEAQAERPPRQRVAYAVLKPGQKASIPITSLHSRRTASQAIKHYWTEPGEYTVSASFYTVVYMDGGKVVGKGRIPYMTLKTRAIKVKVEK